MSTTRDSPKDAKKVDKMEAKAGSAPAHLARVVGQVLAAVLYQVSLGAMEC